jgi:hypothetical protein
VSEIRVSEIVVVPLDSITNHCLRYLARHDPCTFYRVMVKGDGHSVVIQACQWWNDYQKCFVVSIGSYESKDGCGASPVPDITEIEQIEAAMQGGWWCEKCGWLSQAGHKRSDHETKLRAHAICSGCDFWNKRAAKQQQDPSRYFIAKGEAYYIGPATSGPKNFNGFSGRRFVIEFSDGRQVETCNLWANGEVPPSHREELPDNAWFVRDAQ